MAKHAGMMACSACFEVVCVVNANINFQRIRLYKMQNKGKFANGQYRPFEVGTGLNWQYYSRISLPVVTKFPASSL
jgi:hypothetical protein